MVQLNKLVEKLTIKNEELQTLSETAQLELEEANDEIQKLKE